MKIYFKIIIIFGLSLFCIAFLLGFLNSKEIYYWYSFEIKYYRMLTIISFSLFFIVLMFLIDIKRYRQIWRVILILAIVAWSIIYILQLEKIPINSRYFWNVWDTIMFLTYSIIGPGLILYTIHYIEKKSAKFEDARLFGKYHIHEGLVGIIFMILAFIFYSIRSIMIEEPIFYNELVILLGAVQLFLFAFLLFGNFLIIRDWRDVIHFRFIEKKEKRNKDNNENNDISVFSLIQKEDIPFFKISKVLLYPFGILLTSISINAIVFGSNFLPEEIFNLEYQMVINLGFLLGFIAGGFLGVDWVRIFRKFCPEQYEELEQALNRLKD